MLMLISYDVNTTTTQGRRRLRRIAKACLDYGQRVQNSVFECLIDPVQWSTLRQRLIAEFDPEQDSLRFYRLGKSWRGRIEHLGTKPAIDPEGPLIV